MINDDNRSENVYLTDTYFSSVNSKSVFTPGNASDEVEVNFAPLEIC